MKTKPINLQYCETTYPPGETKVLYDNLSHENEKNLYIVSTPLQLLSAIEAQHYFNTKNNILVILFFLIKDGKNINQMFKISESFPYDKLITYRQSNGIKIKTFYKYLQKLKKHQYNYLFFGYGTPIYRRIVANLSYEKIYMLDDGVHSMEVHSRLISKGGNKNTLEQESKNTIKTLRNIVYFTSGIKVDTDLRDLNFFTMFDIKYNNSIIHDFSYVKNLFFKHKIIDNRVYILGQPLKRAIQMKTITYIMYLEKIFNYYNGKDIVYIPHRLEPMTDLFQYVLYKNNVSVLEIDIPIELYFMEEGIVPSMVISFMTSALFTIKKIFPETNLQYIEIDTSSYSEFHQENIHLIYENYKKENIEKLIFI